VPRHNFTNPRINLLAHMAQKYSRKSRCEEPPHDICMARPAIVAVMFPGL
jgi:hypothetical protein